MSTDGHHYQLLHNIRRLPSLLRIATVPVSSDAD